MSSELDEVAWALFNGHIPAIWKKLAPDTLKSLGNWMSHFKRRYEQYSYWVRMDTISFLHYTIVSKQLENVCPVYLVCTRLMRESQRLCGYQVSTSQSPTWLLWSKLHAGRTVGLWIFPHYTHRWPSTAAKMKSVTDLDRVMKWHSPYATWFVMSYRLTVLFLFCSLLCVWSVSGGSRLGCGERLPSEE